jgi:hypothetical protein
VPIQLGADQLPFSNRATTIPAPKEPDQTNPALMTLKIAKPLDVIRVSLGVSAIVHASSPLALFNTDLGMALRADSG